MSAPSPAVAASPAGASALLAALASSALAAAITLFLSELLRVSSGELRERVFTPRVTRRLLLKRREQARGGATWQIRARPACVLACAASLRICKPVVPRLRGMRRKGACHALARRCCTCAR
jgi:hypothetical protein